MDTRSKNCFDLSFFLCVLWKILGESNNCYRPQSNFMPYVIAKLYESGNIHRASVKLETNGMEFEICSKVVYYIK